MILLLGTGIPPSQAGLEGVWTHHIIYSLCLMLLSYFVDLTNLTIRGLHPSIPGRDEGNQTPLCISDLC